MIGSEGSLATGNEMHGWLGRVGPGASSNTRSQWFGDDTGQASNWER